MVCIDEVVAYFKTLKSYERLWMMCRLQSHCLPIELRYLGTCLDYLSKRDVHVLKKLELEANNPASVSEVACKCICDKTVRAAVIKYLSVLNANSTKCSELIFKVLTDDKGLERIFKCPKAFFDDKNAFEELMVLYTLAVNHPAFVFEQKTQLDSIFNSIKREKERQQSKSQGNNKKKDDQGIETPNSLKNINTMIPPPNYVYQQGQGASNFPLNRNGYLYPRQYYPYPPVNVPPMQVCYDFPPPSSVSTVRGPHQANFSKSSSPISWPPRTAFQMNSRHQPPNASLKPRHSTPPRYRSPPDSSYPFTQSWNNWNMYQMSPHNVYANNYNYAPSMVPTFYPENPMAHSYHGHGTKSKQSTFNRFQDHSKIQIQVPESTVSSKTDTGDKSSTLTSSANENESSDSMETHHQESSSSTFPESCNQSKSYNSTSSSVPDNVSIDSSLSAVQNNSHINTKSVETTEVQNDGAKALNSKVISENKINADDSEQIVSNFQSTQSKTNVPTVNSQEDLCTVTKLQTTTSKTPSQKPPAKSIDLTSLSAALEDEENKEKKSSAMLNALTDEKSKSNFDQKQLSSKTSLQNESSLTKESEEKVFTTSTTGTTVPKNTQVTTTTHNLQASKYNKGRSIQSQSRSTRDGNSNNSYHRKPATGPGLPYNEQTRENFYNSHSKLPNNGQQYYTMSYDNGASARAYNTQTYYVHQPQAPQPMSGYSSIPRPYLPQQHVMQSPEYQQVYQQPTEYLYYPSSSQAFYTAPMLMQPQVMAYHPPKVSCYNCGGQNHTGAECTELTMEEITSKGLYENHYGPSMPDGRPRN